MGIITFFKCQRPQDVKSKTGFPDAVGVEKIQKCTDRTVGCFGQVMECGNIPCCYVGTGDMFPV